MSSKVKTSNSNVKRKRNKNRLNMFVLVFVAIFLYVGIVSVKRELEIAESKRELAEIQAQIAQQQQFNGELKSQLSIIDTPEYMEKLAREKLGYARSDEIIYYDASLKK